MLVERKPATNLDSTANKIASTLLIGAGISAEIGAKVLVEKFSKPKLAAVLAILGLVSIYISKDFFIQENEIKESITKLPQAV